MAGWSIQSLVTASHDIDLIVTRPQLDAIRRLAEDSSESRHIGGRNWRATVDGIHLDLYVPYQSRLGQHLQLRTERLLDHQERVGDWVVLDVPAHVATKLAALLDRPDTTPGDKDRQEILSLLALGVEPQAGVGVIHHASAATAGDIHRLIDQAFGYLGDLPLDRVRRRWLNGLASHWAAASRNSIEGRISSPRTRTFDHRGSRRPETWPLKPARHGALDSEHDSGLESVPHLCRICAAARPEKDPQQREKLQTTSDQKPALSRHFARSRRPR